MPVPFEEIRVLLLQARNTPDMIAQEQACFVERARLAPGQLHTANVTRDALAPEMLDGFHALMIGGAGEYSATQEYPWTRALYALIHSAGDRGLPTFGSCWGHQVIANAFGGEVIYDSERAEIGCGFIELTTAGREDPLFGDFPPRFRVNMGHHDRVARLPASAVELAFNESQRNQAFRIADLPVYGTQFHSELDADGERERLIAYRDYYQEVASEDAFQGVMASLGETTEADHLLFDFLNKFVAGEES